MSTLNRLQKNMHLRSFLTEITSRQEADLLVGYVQHMRENHIVCINAHSFLFTTLKKYFNCELVE